MIPRMRAIAIDDEQGHLDAIGVAATKAGFGCVPLLYPNQTGADDLKGLAFEGAHIRIIITDLHLDSGSQTGSNEANYRIIASLINMMNLPKWTPYVLVLWTQYPEDGTGLGALLEQRLQPHQLPGLLIALDKTEYNIPNAEGVPDHEKLWKDLKQKIDGSRALNVLLQWEKEIIQAADNVVRNLLEVARSANPNKIVFDAELDRVLSSLAQTATSKTFAREEPRAATNTGLLPVLIDEVEHLNIDADQRRLWAAALTGAASGRKTPPLPKEIALLNDALHIAKNGKTTGADRGAVCGRWHDDETFKTMFGASIDDAFNIFGLKNWPAEHTIKYVQIEGLCDSTQQKKGVVTFAVACEVLSDVQLVEKEWRAQSIETSPVYPGDGGREYKLIANLRYFFTTEREAAKTHKADFRLRESIVNKWAFLWANHAIRPGVVEFFPPVVNSEPMRAD